MNFAPLIIVAVIVTFLIWLMGMLWRRYYSVDARSLIEASALEEMDRQLQQIGFYPLRERPLFRARTLWTRIERKHLALDLEFCDGDGLDYTRLICRFTEPLHQGIQILCEEGAGFRGWLLSMHEAQISDPEIDDRFILMAKDDDRLKALIQGPLRVLLISLRDRVEDFQLTDQAFFIRLDDVVRESELERLIEDALILGEELIRWAVSSGPISALQTSQYQDALAEMDMYSARLETDTAGQEDNPVDMIESHVLTQASTEANEQPEEQADRERELDDAIEEQGAEELPRQDGGDVQEEE
jgi:hypothetical protein